MGRNCKNKQSDKSRCKSQLKFSRIGCKSVFGNFYNITNFVPEFILLKVCPSFLGNR